MLLRDADDDDDDDDDLMFVFQLETLCRFEAQLRQSHSLDLYFFLLLSIYKRNSR
jgi:hypothetical protein